MEIVENLYENLLDQIDGISQKYNQIIMLGYENFHGNIPYKGQLKKINKEVDPMIKKY